MSALRATTTATLVIETTLADVVQAAAARAGCEIIAQTANMSDGLFLAEMHRPPLIIVGSEAIGFEISTIRTLILAAGGAAVLFLASDMAQEGRAHDAGALEVVARTALLDLEPALERLTEYLTHGRSSLPDRRIHPDRRHYQDWLAVTSERRSGIERRGTDWGPLQGAFNRGEWLDPRNRPEL